MVDKNLFLHDLAVVAIMKNEGHYLKEWLDYHLMAGVDHFYLYDNESPDNQAEVAKPYVEAGLVDYFPLPGKTMQMIAYNNAVKRFKFQSRYMAFIDLDEFIYPKLIGGGGIVESVDKLLPNNPSLAALAVHWQLFGSNGQEKADYSRGVLERFTCRAANPHVIVKSIANPRKINFLYNPHFAVYFEGIYAINENGGVVSGSTEKTKTVDKIVVNHYHTKSREEYDIKIRRGRADLAQNTYNEKDFNAHDCNDEFDDGILRYRAERVKTFRMPDKSHSTEKLLNALIANLSPTLVPTTPPQFYAGKMETFLTCRAVAAYLKTKLTDATPAKFFEEIALKSILKSLGGMSFADGRLLIRELPELLNLPYPVVKELHAAALNIIPQMMEVMHSNGMWGVFFELENLQRLLQTQQPQ